MLFSLKKPRGFLWSTDHSLESVRAKLDRGKIAGDWLICPLGEAERAVLLSTFLEDPTMFDPVARTEVSTAPDESESDRESLGEDLTPVADETSFDRRHDLDALRATAMLLGIALHGALAYITIPFWPVHDTARSGLFDLSVGLVHGFRMPLFFMLSGFFTAMLWRKRGLLSLVRHRVLRIAVPMALFTVTLLPLHEEILRRVGSSWPGSRETSETGGLVEPRKAEDIWTAAKFNDVETLEQHAEEWAELLDRPDPTSQIRPLHWAALNGSTEAARFLIQAGAGVNATIDDGSVPIGHSAFMGHPEIVTLLIENGADVNVVNQYQATPLDSAHGDWKTAQWVANMLQLDTEKEARAKGCEAVIEILEENGGKRRGDLRRADREGTEGEGRGGSGVLEQMRGAYYAVIAPLAWEGGDVFGHLWFLWFLCILLVPFLVYAAAANALNWRGLPRKLFRKPWVFLWLIPLTMVPLVFNNEFGPDTSTGWIPMPHIVVLYAVFFFFGALYFDCDDREGKLVRGWWLLLPVAIIVLFPAGLGLKALAGLHDSLRLLSTLTQALFAWFMIFGLIGLFRKICSQERDWVRYVSDSAYWLYIAHIAVLFVLQAFAKPWSTNAFVKFAFVCLASTAVLLLSYEFFVRYTPLGTLLNGKRTRRPRRKKGEAEGVAEVSS